MNSLIGKTIESAWISGDKTVIQFVCDDGSRLTFFTDGDCCSESWIEHVSGAAGLKGGKVVGFEEVNLPDVTDREDSHAGSGRDDYIQAYSARLKLEGRPDFEIEYRNASNGYYGGSLVEITDTSWTKISDVDCSRNELMEDF